MDKKLQVFKMREDKVESSFYTGEQLVEDETSVSVNIGSEKGSYLKSEMGKLKNDGLYGDWVYVVYFDEEDQTKEAANLFLERLEQREKVALTEYEDALKNIQQIRQDIASFVTDN